MAGYPNYYFPVGYQPVQMQPQTQQIQQMQNNAQNSNSVIWVQGEAGAKAFPVGAGNSVLMMDVESPTVYLKTVEANGMPQPLKVYDLVERSSLNRSQERSTEKTETVTREEFERLRDDVRRLSKGIRKAEVKEVDDGEPIV